MRRCNVTRLFAAVVLTATLSFSAFAQAGSGDSGAPIKVMTRNLYMGTDLAEVMGATDGLELLDAVTQTLLDVRATNPAVRMAAIAREIADQDPDLVGLQEAMLWESGGGASWYTEADLLQALLTELENLGEPYVAVVTVPEFEATVPSSLGVYVHMLSRTALLVRAEALEHRLQISSSQGGLFETVLELPHPVMGSIPVPRGWASVDVTVQGTEFRFITAHPEAYFWLVEVLQVLELLRGPAATGMPVIMAADFNSNAENPLHPTYAAYQAMLGAGFTDTWIATEPRQAGFTCCQANNLTNPLSALDQRIDLILTRGPFVLRGDKLSGDRPDDRIEGLWPSDHAGLTARLRIR